MQELSAVFGQVQELLSAGISIIPVRDKPTTSPSGVTIGAKVAYSGWKKYQTEIISKEQLWHEMAHFDTTAIAMICGAVSGNLEIIDIDCKHWPGIDGRLFADIAQIYPQLYSRLRIHKTPSGGYHILYRIADGLAGKNQKLAWKADNKECGIETRGEGGYALAPPSLGYSIHSGSTIPLITSLERESIINLCSSYNEKIKVAPAPKPSSQTFDYYDENPFDHFNGSIEAESILEQHGYTLFNDHANFRRWARPDRWEPGVSVTFRKDYRLYYFFTTSTEFETSKWYQPATVLAILMFGGDKKKLHAYLVSKGYGRIKPNKEREIASRAVSYKSAAPANLSAEAKEWVNEALAKATEQHPYGIFWAVNDKGNTVISRERLYDVSGQMGYRLHNGELTKIDGYIISATEPRAYFDALKSYIRIEDADEYEKVFNATDEFIQKAGSHVIEHMPLLDTSLLFIATKKEGYKFYKNGYVSITADAATMHTYDNIGKRLIWKHAIHDREITLAPITQLKETLYYKFLQNAIGISRYLFECIGYYAHEYKDEENGYIIILTEECENPKDGGGSGKSLFCKMLKHITTFRSVPGSQVKYDTSLLQTWNGERVFCMGDLPKTFNYMFFKDLTDNDGVVKKLFKNERTVTVAEMPKFIASTNYSFDISDGGLKRRIRPIEFKPFFTVAGGVSEYFGKMFPTDWDNTEWQGYDCIMIAAISAYLKCGGKIVTKELTDSGWAKQFKQNYTELTYQFIQEHLPIWKELIYVLPEKHAEQYAVFCRENNIPQKYQAGSIIMNRAIADYCEHYGIIFNKSDKNQFDARCRSFKTESTTTPKNEDDTPF